MGEDVSCEPCLLKLRLMRWLPTSQYLKKEWHIWVVLYVVVSNTIFFSHGKCSSQEPASRCNDQTSCSSDWASWICTGGSIVYDTGAHCLCHTPASYCYYYYCKQTKLLVYVAIEVWRALTSNSNAIKSVQQIENGTRSKISFKKTEHVFLRFWIY